MFIVLLHLVTH